VTRIFWQETTEEKKETWL